MTFSAPGARRLCTLLLGVVLSACSDDADPVNPTPVSVAGVELTASSETVVGVDGSLQLSVAVQGDDGTTLTDRTVEWTSADDAIATVSAAGMVTGVSLGSTWIRATAEGVSDSLEVRVDRNASGAGWVSVSGGYRHGCAVRTDGDAYCWGDGFLGSGETTSSESLTPVRVEAPQGVEMAVVRAGGFYMSCGLSTVGDAYCWGNARAGGLGNSTTVESAVPVRVEAPGGTTFADIQVAFTHACGLTPAGSVYCWGSGTGGALGNGEDAHSPLPVAVTLPQGVQFTAITTGTSSTCGLSTNGDVYCWGIDYFGEMGTGSAGNQSLPVQVALPANASITGLAGGTAGFHHCAIAADAGMYCWGRNPDGQFGSGETGGENRLPVRVEAPAGEQITSIGRGFEFTCLTTASGSAYCAGKNADGQLGDGTQANSAAMVQVTGVSEHRFDLVAAGFWHACGLTLKGEIYCWGESGYGQMGNGDSPESTPVPVRVSDPTE